jgi:hypothetical protein
MWWVTGEFSSMKDAREWSRWLMNDSPFDGVPPRPYISDRGALTCVYDNDVSLCNSELTELIFLQSCRLNLIWFRCPRWSCGRIRSKLWITFKSHEPSWPALAHSLHRSILPAVLPWPMKGRSHETIGPRPFARPSSLPVDPGDICPPQAPNLWVDFELISPKILGPTCGFDFNFGDRRFEGAPVERCFWTLNDSLKNNLLLSFFAHSMIFALWFKNRHSVTSLCFRDQHFVLWG